MGRKAIVITLQCAEQAAQIMHTGNANINELFPADDEDNQFTVINSSAEQRELLAL
jgi:hypothetical protein